MPFVHNEEEPARDADWMMLARSFFADVERDPCNACLFEAWERMTFGGFRFDPLVRVWVDTQLGGTTKGMP